MKKNKMKKSFCERNEYHQFFSTQTKGAKLIKTIDEDTKRAIHYRVEIVINGIWQKKLFFCCPNSFWKNERTIYKSAYLARKAAIEFIKNALID